LLYIKEARKNKNNLINQFHFKDFPARYYYFLFIVFVFTLGNSTDALLLVKANEVGVKTAMIPLVYLAMNAVSVMASVPAGRLADRIGKEKILFTGYVIYAVVYFGFGINTSTGAIVALFAIYGLYSAATDGVQKAFISDMIDENKKGTGLGIYNSLLGLTLLPASLIAGYLYDKINASIPFYFGAATALVSAVMMLIFLLTKRGRN
jgi:MFS family permease